MRFRLAQALALSLVLPWCSEARAGRDGAPPNIAALVEAALGTDPDVVISALTSLGERGAQSVDEREIAGAAIVTILARDHWQRAARGNEVLLRAMEAAAICGGKASRVAIERVAKAPGTSPTLAARARTLFARGRSIENVKGMLLYFIVSGAGTTKAWPSYGGKRFVLWLAAANLLDTRDARQLSVLFSPGDATRSLEKAGGPKAFQSLTKDTLRDPKLDVGPLTSYAGRRNDDKSHLLTASDLSRNAPVLADLSFPDGVIFGYSGGEAKWVSREELGIPVGVPIVVGDESPNEVLRNFSDR